MKSDKMLVPAPSFVVLINLVCFV